MGIKKEYNDLFHEKGSISKLSESSFLHYTDNYANLKKSDSLNSVIPGKIFVFFYDAEPVGEKHVFANRRPILFVQDRGQSGKGQVIVGVDIMLIPPQERLNFFIRLETVYRNIIAQNQKKIEDGIPKSQMPLRTNIDILETLFGGIKYKHAYKGYKIEKIKILKEVPIEEWKYLIYLNTRSLLGASAEEIYKLAK